MGAGSAGDRDSEQPMDPDGTATEVTGKGERGVAVIDQGAAGLGQQTALTPAHVPCARAGSRGLGARLVMTADVLELGGGGPAPRRQVRVPRGVGPAGPLQVSPHGLEGPPRASAVARIDCLVTPPRDLHRVGDGLLAQRR